MLPPNCTCFHAGPSLEVITEQPFVTAHPLLSTVFHLSWPHAEALLFSDGHIRLTCPELERNCPTHNVPPLASPFYEDRLAMASFKGLPLPVQDEETEGIYPLFGAILADHEVFLYSEPRRGLATVGWIRLPYLYIFGAGGFHYADKDSVELAVLQLLSKEVRRASHDTIHR